MKIIKRNTLQNPPYKDLSEIEKKIDLVFKNKNLLQNVFVHKSYLNEVKRKNFEDNERLEFLGDAVLELSVTEFLYLNYHKSEGELTNWRSALVRGEHLSKIARELDLGTYLLLSRGENKSGGRTKNYLLANTLEALIGAIYLDNNYETANHFIHKFILKYLSDILEKELHIDAKSRFQEKSQEILGITPSYALIKEEGPDHQKTFTMGVYLAEELIATGQGLSKQRAELNAAQNALKIKDWK